MLVWIRLLTRLAVVTFVGAILEGCVLKDPWVELRNGYSIAATHWEGPCYLWYVGSHDRRPWSDWSSFEGDDIYFLRDSQTGELREYASEAELRQAARELHARPANRTLLDQVSEFDQDGRFAIGLSGGGFFLLDMAQDMLETWPTIDGWEAAVRSQTKLDPQRLRDPKSWSLQYRHAAYWAIMGGYAVLGCAWIVRSFVRRPGSKLPGRQGDASVSTGA